MDALLGLSAIAIAMGEKLSQMWKSIPSPASATASPYTITLPTSPPFLLATNYYIASSSPGTVSLVMIANGASTIEVYVARGNGVHVAFNGKSVSITATTVNDIRRFSAIYPV